MQQRLREARIESLFRSVGRKNGHRGVLARLLRRKATLAEPEADGRLRRGHVEIDFHDRGEDVWKALRD
jgi:hypothetical protein